MITSGRLHLILDASLPSFPSRRLDVRSSNSSSFNVGGNSSCGVGNSCESIVDISFSNGSNEDGQDEDEVVDDINNSDSFHFHEDEDYEYVWVREDHDGGNEVAENNDIVHVHEDYEYFWVREDQGNGANEVAENDIVDDNSYILMAGASFEVLLYWGNGNTLRKNRDENAAKEE